MSHCTDQLWMCCQQSSLELQHKQWTCACEFVAKMQNAGKNLSPFSVFTCF